MGRFEATLNNKEVPSYITPLFWQHGESEEVLRNEIRQMNENGIGSFIVESRPHPDFLGELWWSNLDAIIDEAGKRNMKVWIFDDSAFPSGFGAGRVRDKHPEYLKKYICERHIDAVGPLEGSSFLVYSWLGEGEKIVRVIAARRVDRIDRIDGDTLTDLTDKIHGGVLYWDVPEGDWRIFMFIDTREGGEEGTKDYLNPLEAGAVRVFIDAIYEEHYRRYPKEFGKTIAGFFSDEPRFGNASTYEAAIGRYPMVLPYSDSLLEKLSAAWESDFGVMLPCLWYEAGSATASIRYTYMDVVSRLYGKNFTEQIGDWCREHKVKLIGHVVEDNGAHARLGYGSGHFFRAIHGQDYSGLDVVYQVWPEYTSGRFTTPFGYLYADFFYWGITKMASSAGHIDPKKNGTTVCEIFGAYGWQEGLKLMKWLTDHICVRGVNFLIPHAFSPKYPDTDCPPHFYAQGYNPQWKYFKYWADYSNRICNLLSGGIHSAPVAVVYHAEAEWSGEYQPFHMVVKALALSQIDCDVLPMDLFLDGDGISVRDGEVCVNKETYRAIIVPYAERIPEDFAQKLLELVKNNFYVIFMNGYPSGSCGKEKLFAGIIDEMKRSSCSMVRTDGELAGTIMDLGLYDIKVTNGEEYLRYYHYTHEDEDIYFFTNESKYKTVDTTVTFKKDHAPVAYDAMIDKAYTVECSLENGHISANLELKPYESRFIIFSGTNNLDGGKFEKKTEESIFVNDFRLDGEWRVSILEAGKSGGFEPAPGIDGLGNISVPGKLPDFSGTIRYETEFDFDGDMDKVLLELGAVYEIAEVKLNGIDAGVRICPPYVFEITKGLKKGKNILQIDVTNTLAKKHGNNVFDRGMPQEPSGLLGPVKLKY